MFEKNSVLTLGDNNQYCVVDKYEEKGIIYLYLVDINNNSNIIFGKLENDEVVELSDIDELERMIKTVNERLHSN